jgi:hypothetical protein
MIVMAQLHIREFYSYMGAADFDEAARNRQKNKEHKVKDKKYTNERKRHWIPP